MSKLFLQAFLPDRSEWRWLPRSDLFGSTDLDRHFVVEMDNDGTALLRFGDDELGQQPAIGTRFYATYRIGNGPTGNIGADTISHIVFRQTQASGVTLRPHNPFPTQGGTLPESLAEVKLYAPHSFRKQVCRAITAQDYADIVMRDFPAQVQRAAATLRWTCSWFEVMVAIDPLYADTRDSSYQELIQAIERHLYRFRRMGQDVVVQLATSVYLDIEMKVCVKAHYRRVHVKAALLEVFSDRQLPTGELGFFHPDNLTFGVGIALSRLVAVAQSVPGVETVVVTKLERWGEGPQGEKERGILSLGPLEIARLDNNPNFPENGQFKLIMPEQ